jgi:hypothetical protein
MSTEPDPGGLVAWITVADIAVKNVAAVAPNRTTVAYVRFEPVMVTVVPPPAGPALTLNLATPGGNR